MAYEKVAWINAIMQVVSNAVRGRSLEPYRDRSDAEASVAVIVGRLLPLPAVIRIGNSYIRPEASRLAWRNSSRNSNWLVHFNDTPAEIERLVLRGIALSDPVILPHLKGEK